jgi:hypothetical protein
MEDWRPGAGSNQTAGDLSLANSFNEKKRVINQLCAFASCVYALRKLHTQTA